MKYLLDTCALSELFRTTPNKGVSEWILGRPMEDLFLSVITIGEIQKGISKSSDSSKIIRLSGQLEAFIALYADRILPLTRDILVSWGKLCGKSEAKGQPLPVLDSLIAASAIAHGMEIVTRNVKDLELCGAQVVNPWK